MRCGPGSPGERRWRSLLLRHGPGSVRSRGTTVSLSIDQLRAASPPPVPDE
ncbi:hypothetical protein Rhow_001483 [Rhodococcus wratislaviensis]|uniref:Uncharacterized protein n=1 Tax=Rhodococcus wratislaviensis TaxID=44752 RepID=A0A402C4B1_RHOWR|nr:hypothetical protein Rhow_001483 [Rhodococcus wratislaviensis]